MRIPFFKMHVCGNHFVFVDELGREPLPDDFASFLARRITDPYTGVGADGLIRLGGDLPSEGSVVSMRLLEPDGVESLSCGNGLLCAGHYMACHYGIRNLVFQTQIPTGNPVAVASGETGGRRWIRMPAPAPLPSFLFCPEAWPALSPKNGKLEFHLHSLLNAFSKDNTVESKLYFKASPIFTGEPHLVVHVSDLEPQRLGTLLFSRKPGQKPSLGDAGSYLVYRMGKQVMRQYPGLFPHGVNLMVARVSPEGDKVFYRSFERGNLRETLACGTGALACAAVLGRGKSVTVIPEMARRHLGATGYTVIRSKKEWHLYGDPEILWEGVWVEPGQERLPETEEEGFCNIVQL